MRFSSGWNGLFQTVHSGSQKAFDKHSSSCLSDELLQDYGYFLAGSRLLQIPANWPLRTTLQAHLPDPSQWNKLRASCWHSSTLLCQLFLPRDASPSEAEKGAPSHTIHINSWRFAVLCGQSKKRLRCQTLGTGQSILSSGPFSPPWHHRAGAELSEALHQLYVPLKVGIVLASHQSPAGGWLQTSWPVSAHRSPTHEQIETLTRRAPHLFFLLTCFRPGLLFLHQTTPLAWMSALFSFHWD